MTDTRRAAILFSGGPAPAANSVISSAVMSFRRAGIEVVGIHHGYRSLVGYDEGTPLVDGEDYHLFDDRDLWALRNQRGVVLGTDRANPGKLIRTIEDLDDPERCKPLHAVCQGLRSLGVSMLVSIGGDDTLKTANLLHRYQERLPEGVERIRIVHVPKTIDNDYRGIDFTFGFFTAVDTMAKELLNLRADAVATGRYYVVECMGRKAGWLSYGVAIAGEAHMVVGVEDVIGELADASSTAEAPKLSLDALVERVVDLVEARATKGKRYGTIVLAEGLVELLPDSYLEGLPRDDHGHLSLGGVDIGKIVAKEARRRAVDRGVKTKFVGIQLGYESRCAAPHAFDVMLGTQLGRGAWRALDEEGLDGHMVSIAGQLDLQFVPFSDLIAPGQLRTDVRFIERGSDFHALAHALGTRLPST
jgi:6-phosphofructokinase 1